MLPCKERFILHAKVYKDGDWRPIFLEIEGGAVRAVFEQIEEVAPDVKLLDLSDCYITPGLVDSHVHIALDAINLEDAIAGWADKEAIREHAISVMQQFLDAGVTHVRDGGDAAGIGMMARRMKEDEGVPAPNIIACGHALYRRGRYGDFLGTGFECLENGFRQIEAIASYTSCLKICQSGIVSFKTDGHVGSAQFSLQELSRLVEYAHEKGLSVMAHASGDEAVDIALLARVDTIEHGYYISEDTIELMSELGTVWVPTLSPLANLVKHPDLLYPGADIEVIKRAVHDQKTKLNLAHDKGVRIAVGTDAGAVGVPHGASIYDEIEHIVSAGIPRESVFKMACIEGRRLVGEDALGVGDSLSGWQNGDRFDAVAFKKDPLKEHVGVKDIAATVISFNGKSCYLGSL